MSTCPTCGKTFAIAGHLGRHQREVICDPARHFWAKIDRRGPDECWPWLPKSRRRGYGVLRVGGRSRVASQVAWEIANGQPFPSGMYACHTCDNPPCANPAHIFPGTNADNQYDSIDKGRARWSGRTQCKRGHPIAGPGRCLTCRTAAARSRKWAGHEYVRVSA